MGNYFDTPQKKYVAAAGVAVFTGISLMYVVRRLRRPSAKQERKRRYLEILDRDPLAGILKQIRKQYSDKFNEAKKSHRAKRRSLESTELDLYRQLVMRFNNSITPMFEEVRDRVLVAHGVDKDLLHNSINFYEGNDPEIVKLATNASIPFNNARAPKTMTLELFSQITAMYEEVLTSDPDMEEDELLYEVAKLDDEIFDIFKIEPEELDKFYSEHEEDLHEMVSMLKMKTNVVFTSSETRDDSF